MSQQRIGPKRSIKTRVRPPEAADTAKQKQRQKAEAQEVAGRHKNDGQKPHKGRR